MVITLLIYKDTKYSFPLMMLQPSLIILTFARWMCQKN